MVDIAGLPQNQAHQAAHPAGAALMHRAIKQKARNAPVMTGEAVERGKKSAPKQSSTKKRGSDVNILA